MNSEWRRLQGHHRQRGASASVALYSRDDTCALQTQLVDKIIAGFRPLKPVSRGAACPLPDIPVHLPAAPVAPVPAHAPVPSQPSEPQQEITSPSSSSSSTEDSVSGASSRDEDVGTDQMLKECALVWNARSRVAHRAKYVQTSVAGCLAIPDESGQQHVVVLACGAQAKRSPALKVVLQPPRCSRCCKRLPCCLFADGDF